MQNESHRLHYLLSEPNYGRQLRQTREYHLPNVGLDGLKIALRYIHFLTVSYSWTILNLRVNL